MRRDFGQRAGTGQDMVDTFEFGLRDYGTYNPGHAYHFNPGHSYHAYGGADLRNLSELPGNERAEAITGVVFNVLFVGSIVGGFAVTALTGGAAGPLIAFVGPALAAGFAVAEDRECDKLYQWGGWKRDDTENAADVMNGVYGGLSYYLEQTCRLRCELAWWINQRQWHHSDEASLESKLAGGMSIDDQHGCGKEDQCSRINIHGQLTDFGGKAPTSKTEKELRALLLNTPQGGVNGVYFTPGWFHEKTDCTISTMLTKAVIFYADLIAEYNQMTDIIKYEMGQRDNLVKLRDQKGIEPWHLEIIYSDRDERMAATNPESAIVQENIAEEKARPYIWLGVGTAIAMGAILVGGTYRSKAMAKRGVQ